MKISVYVVRERAGYSHRRAEHVARAMCEGFRRHGVAHECLDRFDGRPRGDIAVAYGWIHENVFRAYPRYVYWDLGYWNRRPEGAPSEGAHRLALNDWDTATHMPRGMPSDRFDTSGIKLRAPVRVQPWRAIVAGMSAKSARVHGFHGDAWERAMVAQLADLDWAPELRPKASKTSGRVLEPIERVLDDCGLLATHHSNCAVDALIAGVPVWSVRGVGRLWSPAAPPAWPDAQIPEDVERLQLLADLAYAQWTPAEMRSGEAWDFIQGRL